MYLVSAISISEKMLPAVLEAWSTQQPTPAAERLKLVQGLSGSLELVILVSELGM